MAKKCDYHTTRNDGVLLVKTYSNTNKYIKQNETGIEYTEAIDVGVKIGDKYYPKNYTYIETEKEIEEVEY